MEIHLSGWFIEAVSSQEGESRFGPATPGSCARILLQLRGGGQCLQHPAHPSLSPDGFIGINQCAVTIKAMQEALVLQIEAAWEPEREAIVEQQVSIQIGSLLTTGW